MSSDNGNNLSKYEKLYKKGANLIKQAKKLKLLNVKRYNHNLETSRSKFPEICTTHTFEDRIQTLKIARDAGLELCTGGII